MAAIVGAVVVIGPALAIALAGDGAEPTAPSAASTSSTTASAVTTQTTVAPSTTSTSGCVVTDVRVAANGPLDDVGLRFNPEFEVTASFLESGGDAILHVNTGYQDEATDQWVIYTWIEAGNLPTPEEAAIPNGVFDSAANALTGTDTLHYLLDYEEVAGSPIAAPFTATYDSTASAITGSVTLSDGPHTFTLTAQRTDVLEGPDCTTPTQDSPTP